MRFLGALLFTLLLAQPALAGEGVIEINEARVAAGGITPCDAPGYPVSICDAGSYRLTSDLHFPSASSNAIVVIASDVTIDLNGMTIRGDNTCSVGANGWVTSCAVEATLRAIDGGTRMTLRNGRIRGASASCVYADREAVIQDVVVAECGNAGIRVGDRSRLSNVSALRTRYYGIQTSTGCVVREAVVASNSNSGLYLGIGSTAERVSATANGYAGIQMYSATLSGFSAQANGANGVNAETGSLVESGTIRDNGRADSGHCGLWGGGATAYRSLVITATAGGNPSTACGGAVNLGGNSCQWGACPP